MRIHLYRAAVIVLAMILLLPYAAAAETKLMVVSDLHSLALSLYQGSGFFLRVLRNGDGKMPQYGEELLSALYQEVLEEKPDALIVTGDLTYNGERKSHEALAAWFKTVEDAGVPVWVIPGNHDINTATPVGFTDEGYYLTESVTPEDFAAIYADYMEPDDAGFSYAVTVGDDLVIAMTDVAWYQGQAQTFGLFDSARAAWLESVLQEAEGKAVITATHHSLIPHTAFSQDSYLMFGSESMAALARQYGVRLNLSGHLHIQHIAQDDGLSDAALGAFCLWPHRYAAVTLDDTGALTYEAKGLNPAYLPEGFLETSKEWFVGITHDKVKAYGLNGTEEEIEAMADYAARFNLAYFSGTYSADDPAWTSDPAYALWERQDSMFWTYMKLVMNEPNGENLTLEIAP